MVAGYLAVVDSFVAVGSLAVVGVVGVVANSLAVVAGAAVRSSVEVVVGVAHIPAEAVADSFADFHNIDFVDCPSVAFCLGQALLQKL